MMIAVPSKFMDIIKDIVSCTTKISIILASIGIMTNINVVKIMCFIDIAVSCINIPLLIVHETKNLTKFTIFFDYSGKRRIMKGSRPIQIGEENGV